MGAHRSGRTSESRPDLTELVSPDTDRQKRILYGRRQGRPLRAAQQRLLAERLPAYEVDLAAATNPSALFDPPRRRIWLEIGFGGGEHLAAQAATHPEVGLIGCEPFVNGVAKLLRRVELGRIENIRIFADDARALLDALPDASVERCFILFPDPWPKTRHHRRRIVSPETLDALARILTDGGLLRLASDHRGYVRWILFHATRHDAFEWRARGASDWRTRPRDWPATRYEEKAAARGVDSVYLEFARRPH